MFIFGVCFLLYFAKLAAGKVFFKSIITAYFHHLKIILLDT